MTVSAKRTAATSLPAWLAPVAVGAATVAATVTLGAMDPETRAQWSPGCPFRALTGLDCPGCGGTRAVYALTHGDVALAFEHNVLAMVILPLLVVGWVGWLAARLGWRDRPFTLSGRQGYAIAAAFTVFWIVRNLPWFPFTWLASGGG